MTLDVVLEESWRREQLASHHAQLKEGLTRLGYGGDVQRSDRQILAIVTGDAPTTSAFRDACAAKVRPATPDVSSRCALLRQADRR